MSNNGGPFLEDVFPESLSEIYTLENINSMVSEFEELFNINFSNQIFDSLEGNTERYIRTALEIKEAIKIYEKESGEKYDFNGSPLENNIQEQDLMKQMQEFNAQTNNILSIDGSEFKPEVQKKRNGVKIIVGKLLQKLKKKS